MKAFLSLLTILLLLTAAASVYVVWQAQVFLETPPQSPGAEVVIDVPSGATFAQVTQILLDKGLITDSFKFKLLARYKELDNKLQAGRFNLHTGWLPEAILQHLVVGKPILHRVTLREGLTWWQTARVLEQHGLVHFDDFRACIMDKDFLRNHGIPFNSAEGFLMPDTYLLKKEDEPTKADACAIAGRLVDTFWQKMAPYWPNATKPNQEALRRLIILASIVERETGIASERRRVAGVYANRLRIKMPLQADPTIIYGLGPSFDGNLRRKHIDDKNNIYNTYQHGGLTPGPICSPGVAAVRAAIDPEKHAYLYFVAVTDGGEHAFSKTLTEHNRAVRRYLNNRKKQ